MATIGCALTTPMAAPAPHSRRLSANSMRRNAPLLAPSATRTASSPSRRTVRARIRLATLEHAMMKTSPDAASSTSSTVLAPDVISSRSNFSPSLIEGDSGSQTAENLSHAMDAASDHGCGKMMRAGDHVGNNFGIFRIWYAGLENANDCCRAITEAAEANGLAED